MKVNNVKNNFIYIFLGTFLEHMDSLLFALYLPVIAAHFFDAQNVDAKWFLGFLAFSLYFVVRPAGALILGLIGDKYGRKRSLLISIAVMSSATLGMGLLPPYTEIGIYSTLIFLVLRILQGLSVGGEYSTAMTYVFETSRKDRQLFFGGLLIAANHFGGAIAAICAFLHPEHFQTIFVLAGCIGLMSLKGRVLLTETFRHKTATAFSVREYFLQASFKRYINVIAASACLVFIFYTTVIYFNKLITQKFDVSMKHVFCINIILHVFWIVLTPVFGLIADKYSIAHFKVMRLGSIVTICLGVPVLIVAYNSGYLLLFVLAQIMITISHIIFCMPTPKMICSLFTVNTRNAHVSFSYAIGISIAASSMPSINGFAFTHGGIYGTAALIALFSLLGYLSTTKNTGTSQEKVLLNFNRGI